MQKLLTFVLIIVLLIIGGVLFLTQRYKIIGTNSSNALIFDSVKCSFIEKNAKGEWEEKELKKGEVFIGFEQNKKENTGTSQPMTTPESKPQPKPKPELKI